MVSGPPIFKIQGKTLPEVWEKAVAAVYEHGVPIATEYNPDERSRDCTMVMVIEEPLSEPRIHRGASISGSQYYHEYTEEVLEGVNNHHVYEGKLPYTYHQRLFDYTLEDAYRRPALQGTGINQIEYIVEKLSSSAFSRRAQGITWNPASDPHRDDPPCLQRVWFRLYKLNQVDHLVMNTHWRSRDGFNASFLNMYALTLLQQRVADRIQKRINRPVKIGQYVDVSDSFHIYERALPDVERFLNAVKNLPWEKRTWSTDEFEKKSQTQAV